MLGRRGSRRGRQDERRGRYRCGHRRGGQHGLHWHAVVARARGGAGLVKTARPTFAVLVDEDHNNDDGDQGEDGADSETHGLGMNLEEMKARGGRADGFFSRHVCAAVDGGFVGWTEGVQLFLCGFVDAVSATHFWRSAEDDLEGNGPTHKTRGSRGWKAA